MIATLARLKHYSHLLALVGILQLAIAFTNQSKAQYHFGIGTNYVYCFGERIIPLQGDVYHLDHTQGFEVLAMNRYQFKGKLHANLNLGFRYLTFAGRSENVNYNGATHKIFASGGIGYAITEKFKCNGYMEAENNVAFNQILLGYGDLFRVNLAAELEYSLTKKVKSTLLVSRAMTPITNAYIFTNPQYQFRIGFNYQLF